MASVPQQPDALAAPLKPVPARAPDGRVRGLLREAGDLTTFAGSAVKAVPGSAAYLSEALRHAAMMLRGTLPMMFVMNVFQGAVVANFAFFLLRTLGASDVFGFISGYVTPRQTATTMFGYVFAAKICCGITAELGAMKIQQEVDAFESTGVDPRRYLVGTRMLAIILFVPVASVVAVLGGIFGAYVIAVEVLQGLSGNQMMALNWSAQSVNEYLFAIGTMGTMAVVCGLVACFYGLRTVGGPAAVGGSVARSLIVNLVLLHIIAGTFAVLVYGYDQLLPVGG